MIDALRILFSTGALDNLNEGPAHAVSILAGELQKSGDAVTLLGTVGRAGVAPELITGAQTIPLRRTGPSNVHFVAGLSKYRSVIADPEFLSLHGAWVYLNHQVATMFGGIPYMLTAHGCLNAYALRIQPHKKWLASRLYARRLLEGASCLRALNEAEYHSIRAVGLTNPVCIIPNGVYLPSAGAHTTYTNIRTCLYLGRIHPIKGVELLVSAWRRVTPKNWKLVIAGPAHGHHEQQFLAGINTSGAGDISVIGPANGKRKDQLLRSADLIVLPSYSEGLPMQLLEGMAYSKPILMTRACNMSQAVAAGAGIECDTTPNSLAEALAAVTEFDRTTLESMGRRGRRLAEAEFSWTSVAAASRDVQLWASRGGPIPTTVHTS